MRLPLPYRMLLVAAMLAMPCWAMAQQQQPPAGPPPPPMPTMPQQVASLADQPATHSSFTFDRAMLESAQGMIGTDATDARRIVAGLNSITVDTYHFQQPAFYAPEGMATLVATFDAAGWKHLVNAHATTGQSAQPSQPMTDLWLHFRGGDIDDVAVLSRGPRTMNLVQVAGDLRPLDLLHLSGHFGIPRVDPNAVMVPAPQGR